MKYVSIFHANLNYAFLEPHKYEQVIRASYEKIIDGHAKIGPEAKYVFEASGFTIDIMARETPDVLKKLREAIESGQCEFMGAPYSHPIMANIPEEDCYWSVEFAQRAYEKHLGFRAKAFWNPECTWMQYVPRAFRRAGCEYLTLDFESYMNCNDKEYAWVERNRTHDMNWGGHLPWYDLDPDCKFLHRPFKDVVPGMKGFCRSDRLVGKYPAYFLGRIELDEFIDNVKAWSGTNEDNTSIIIADDAEYMGTSGYFFVKYFRDYSKSFSINPEAPDRLDKMLKAILELGELKGFMESCDNIEPVEEPFYVEDRFAWHRTYADAWGGTPEAKAWDPILSEIRRDYKEHVQPITEGSHKGKFTELTEKFWYHLTNSANSDGRWPPPPAETCPFNRQWVLDEIEETKKVLAELKDKTKGIELPEKELADMPEPGEYGYTYTEKDPQDVANLNWYELQHAIYEAWRKIDHEPTHDEGVAFLRKIFKEFERRGVKDYKTPDPLK